LFATDDDDPSPEHAQEELTRSARVIEMMLIKDHSRMKFESKLPYDSTHEQQWRLMPVSHPENFADFIEAIDASKLPDDDPDMANGMDALRVIRQLEEIEDGGI